MEIKQTSGQQIRVIVSVSVSFWFRCSSRATATNG
jgi:hypothetical protein